jgi:hypothetical protein
MWLLPLSTTATRLPEMSLADWEAEAARLFRRQQAIAAVAEGRMDDDILYDMLAEDGINPHEWAENSIANIEFILFGA